VADRSSSTSLLFSWLLQGGRRTVLARAALIIAAIAIVDWRVDPNISFGFLYLFPMLMVGGVLARWQIALVAVVCTVLGESFGPAHFILPEGPPRVILVFAAYCGSGFFIYELAKNRQLTMQHVADMEREVERRREAEEQLTFLIESSPAAILTLDSGGRVSMANEAADRLLGFDPGALQGRFIGSYLPALASVPPLDESAPVFRTEMECRGRRKNGEMFLAEIWFSTYRTMSGPRLAAVVVDTSEDLRDREESNLRQLMDGSRILVGAVCHEIRNLCGAIAVVHANLARDPALAASEDFKALGALVGGLGKMASLELRNTANESADGLDVAGVLDELRIVIEPAFRDSGISIQWTVEPELPLVHGDRQMLLQALLNLAGNSKRALEGHARPELAVEASSSRSGLDAQASRVLVRVRDNGLGVADPERLFQPFQRGAESTGLGLYLSRAFVRTFEGDLQYEPRPQGCCFRVELTPILESELSSSEPKHDAQIATPAGGRPHAVSGEPEPVTRI
jgi:two-component system sensor kinase FixL